MTEVQQELDKLHVQLGLKSLNPVWAKVEILLGLLAASSGLLCGIYGLAHFNRDPLWTPVVASVLLQTLGGYLAMAGHRSHLYQSQNRIAAWLSLQACRRQN